MSTSKSQLGSLRCYLNLAGVMSLAEHVGQTSVVAISIGDQRQHQQKHPCVGCPMCVIASCSEVLVLAKSPLALCTDLQFYHSCTTEYAHIQCPMVDVEQR